jgi:hypothetical protein
VNARALTFEKFGAAEAAQETKQRSGVAAPQSCTVVASDGKAKCGNNKKQRKEEAEAEMLQKRQEREVEYRKWRAAQVAELESAKSAAAAARSDSSAAVTAGASATGPSPNEQDAGTNSQMYSI